jgi:hypothetical protein
MELILFIICVVLLAYSVLATAWIVELRRVLWECDWINGVKRRVYVNPTDDVVIACDDRLTCIPVEDIRAAFRPANVGNLQNVARNRRRKGEK